MIAIRELYVEILATAILVLVVVILRFFSAKVIKHYAKTSEILEHRANLVIRYNNIFLTILFCIGIFIIWGVQTDDIFLTISSVVTVVGVAFFAQWSILSNVTSGIILLFSFPFKIGDIIKIHDKDFPIEAEIEDIRAFHTLLRTKDGERISYPNNLMLQKGISIINNFYEDQEFTD
ncbi:mechanosensitive ion channel domain-containing protein [Flavobacterium caeni]|uniref:Mechanosensitive ion channel n=1 Tax=Flavobacterium caeni TaxID=490189 RepID=A0A1G5BN45_9FLAO|nr:mechanosensitive ion channel family protein [Flavobacterium caeni]SCX91497.1 Mechanosensitive ion channel [Flavobacterium caeni]